MTVALILILIAAVACTAIVIINFVQGRAAIPWLFGVLALAAVALWLKGCFSQFIAVVFFLLVLGCIGLLELECDRLGKRRAVAQEAEQAKSAEEPQGNSSSD